MLYSEQTKKKIRFENIGLTGFNTVKMDVGRDVKIIGDGDVSGLLHVQVMPHKGNIPDLQVRPRKRILTSSLSLTQVGAKKIRYISSYKSIAHA